jgi:hypothetical protein
VNQSLPFNALARVSAAMSLIGTIPIVERRQSMRDVERYCVEVVTSILVNTHKEADLLSWDGVSLSQKLQYNTRGYEAGNTIQ